MLDMRLPDEEETGQDSATDLDNYAINQADVGRNFENEEKSDAYSDEMGSDNQMNNLSARTNCCWRNYQFGELS